MTDSNDRKENQINRPLITSNIIKKNGYVYLGDSVSYRFFSKRLRQDVLLIESNEDNIDEIIDMLEDFSRTALKIKLKVFISTYVAIILDNKDTTIIKKLNKNLKENNEENKVVVFDYYEGNTLNFKNKIKK